MRHWLYWIAGCALLLTGGLQLYSALRADGGAPLSDAARLRRRASLASGCGSAAYGAALLYQMLVGEARVEVFIAGALVFSILVLAGSIMNLRAQKVEARSASAAGHG